MEEVVAYRDELIQVAAVAIAAVQNFDSGTTAISGDGVVDDLSAYLSEIYKERMRQESKWGPQNRIPEKWIVILAEEFGEAAKDVLEENYGL